MSNINYSRIGSILESKPGPDELKNMTEAMYKIRELCVQARVTDINEAIWPVPKGEMEETVKRRLDMFLAEAVIEQVETGITPGMLAERVNFAFTAISSCTTDKRLLTPLVILWAAGHMSRYGMEPGLCFTQILQYMYTSDDRDNHKYDLKYAFRDADVLKSFRAVQDATMIDPVVKRDFLLSMKQMLTYLSVADRDFKKKLTLTQVEKYL